MECEYHNSFTGYNIIYCRWVDRLPEELKILKLDMKVKILVVGIQITQERQRRIVEMIASKITDEEEKQRLGRDRLAIHF